MLRAPLSLALFAALALPGFAADGAVFTVKSNGTPPNNKAYASKLDVFLSGGPELSSACLGPGLADGEYFFQVTDPSGSNLLSSDGIDERRVLVAGGKVAAYLGTTHATALIGPCGAAIVQLAPYFDAPGTLGEYRVWLTPVDHYDTNGTGFFGFLADFSEVDHFRVPLSGRPVRQSVIRGAKFYDHDEDGAWNQSDPAEKPIPGWRIEIYAKGVLQDVTYTDADGRYLFVRDRDGLPYTIREQAPGGFIGDGIAGAIWLATTPREGDVVVSTELVAGPVFGNLSFEVKPGVGRPKGFWHETIEGKEHLAGHDPLWRDTLTTWNGSPLCLRTSVSSSDPALSIFAPPPFPEPFPSAFNAFRSWMTAPSHDHAGFLLSREVAAALLDYRCGFMQFTAYIDRFHDGVLVKFEDMVTQVQTMLLCAEGAGLTGPNDPYQELRAEMFMCINEFGSINNTGDPNSTQVVFGPRALPQQFGSPYQIQ